MIDFQLEFLTFIGLGDEEGKPKFGLTIKPNVRKYYTIQNVENVCKTIDLSKLKESNILSKLLSQVDMDIINNNTTTLFNQEDSSVKLNISQKKKTKRKT